MSIPSIDGEADADAGGVAAQIWIADESQWTSTSLNNDNIHDPK